MNKLELDYETLDESEFESIADILLNQSHLMVNGNKYRLAEIEFYLRSNNHPDDYVHCDPDQLLFKKFYFHKFKTGTYKAGTFKGMDITLGDADSDTYFGILIRAIYDIKSKQMIEGPCNVVNKILSEYGFESIKEFTNGEALDILDNDHQFVIKKTKNLPREDIFAGGRIGLSAKYPDYVKRSYRFVVKKDLIKKQKSGLVVIEI
jgi:hypothetical protein